MTLHTMTIPDDPFELPHWLEERLMAPDFGRFVAELLAHFPPTPGDAPPHQLLKRWLPVALNEGLEPIPPEVLTQLLRHPVALAAFQERIATDGGEYWDRVLDRTDDLSEEFELGKRFLGRLLAQNSASLNGKAISKRVPKAATKVEPKAEPSESVKKRTSGRGYRIWAITSTVSAACLAVMLGYLAFREPDELPIQKSQIAWGWGKPSGLALDQSNPKDYLNKLAANAGEWSLYQPSDSVGVGVRIAELRIGCTRLMHSSYGPLGPDDKAWLLDRCREWGKQMDGHQQALDAGADPLAVRAEVDETVRVIVATLREKAKQVR